MDITICESPAAVVFHSGLHMHLVPVQPNHISWCTTEGCMASAYGDDEQCTMNDCTVSVNDARWTMQTRFHNSVPPYFGSVFQLGHAEHSAQTRSSTRPATWPRRTPFYSRPPVDIHALIYPHLPTSPLPLLTQPTPRPHYTFPLILAGGLFHWVFIPSHILLHIASTPVA